MKKSGIIVLNKQAGISSNTAVNKVKRLIGAEKAGHLGTLDMLGEGVLPVTLNKATRLFDYFLTKNKTYRAVFLFGFETETLDCEGQVTNIKYNRVSRLEIEKILHKFTGKIMQLPPQFSALKINGKTAYKQARKGERVELKSRPVEIYSLRLLDDITEEKRKELIDRFFQFHDIDLQQNEDIKNSFKNNVFEFEITCSSGTYIRSLCRDIASAIATYGTMLCIVRTICGNFELKDSFSLEDISNGKFGIIDIEKVIDLPCVYMEEKQGKDILDGKKVKNFPVHETHFKLYCGNVFYGIANNKNDGFIEIETFLKD